MAAARGLLRLSPSCKLASRVTEPVAMGAVLTQPMRRQLHASGCLSKVEKAEEAKDPGEARTEQDDRADRMFKMHKSHFGRGFVIYRRNSSGKLAARGPSIRAARNAGRPGTINIISTREEVTKARQVLRSTGTKLGLVPTMGALHEGHLSLVRAAAKDNDEVWVSIFVNPAQFGPTEDLASYPRTLESDIEKLERLNEELKAQKQGLVTMVFNPTVTTMYPGYVGGQLPADQQSYVVIDPSLTQILEGAARPTFFRGVSTVVMKLFNFVRPNTAYFGQKDVQQLSVINRMVRDFMLDVDIRAVPIERTRDGLALSSRNVYLGKRRRQVGLVLSRALAAAEAAIKDGETHREKVVGAAMQVFRKELERQRALPPAERARFEVEYVSMSGFHDMREIEYVNDAKTVVLSGTIVMLPLEEPAEGEELGDGGDVKSVRLLDNVLWRNPNWAEGRGRRARHAKLDARQAQQEKETKKEAEKEAEGEVEEEVEEEVEKEVEKEAETANS